MSLVNKTFTNQDDASDYFVGKTFKTIRAKGKVPSGSVITCTHISYGKPVYVYCAEYPYTYFTPSELKELPLNEKMLKEKINALEKDKKEITAKINVIKDQIKFLKETDSETLDENEFKAYRTLTLVEDPSLTKIKKAKLIAELIGK